jgi:glycosyltransferase involved in cell wall biosynthesis
MRQKIAMLLNGPVFNDYRVIKMIQTLSKDADIDLYYMDGNPEKDNQLFEKNVQFFSYQTTNSFSVKLLKHSFFCYEFNFLIKKVLNKKIAYDYVWCNDLPTLNAGFRISKKIQSKLVYDSHEIYVETINQFFPKNSHFVKHFVIEFIIKVMKFHGTRVERKLISQIDKFITVNESLLNYFKQKYSLVEGIVIMNVPRKSDSIVINNPVHYTELYKWDKADKILLYQGFMNEGRGLDLLIDTVSILPSQFKLVLIGNGPLKNSLLNKVNLLNLSDRIKFIDTKPIKELPSYTAGATIGINLLESYNLSKQLASPNKLFEYIHAGIPIIASDTVENKIVLNNFKVGNLTSNSTEKIKQVILSLTDDELRSFKSNMLEASNYYNWENQESKILSVLK